MDNDVIKTDEFRKTDLTLFTMVVDPETIYHEEVKSVTMINGADYLTEEQHEEAKQLMAQAAGIIIEGLRKQIQENFKNITDIAK